MGKLINSFWFKNFKFKLKLVSKIKINSQQIIQQYLTFLSLNEVLPLSFIHYCLHFLKNLILENLASYLDFFVDLLLACSILNLLLFQFLEFCHIVSNLIVRILKNLRKSLNAYSEIISKLHDSFHMFLQLLIFLWNNLFLLFWSDKINFFIMHLFIYFTLSKLL